MSIRTPEQITAVRNKLRELFESRETARQEAIANAPDSEGTISIPQIKTALDNFQTQLEGISVSVIDKAMLSMMFQRDQECLLNATLAGHQHLFGADPQALSEMYLNQIPARMTTLKEVYAKEFTQEELPYKTATINAAVLGVKEAVSVTQGFWDVHNHLASIKKTADDVDFCLHRANRDADKRYNEKADQIINNFLLFTASSQDSQNLDAPKDPSTLDTEVSNTLKPFVKMQEKSANLLEKVDQEIKKAIGGKPTPANASKPSLLEGAILSISNLIDRVTARAGQAVVHETRDDKKKDFKQNR